MLEKKDTLVIAYMENKQEPSLNKIGYGLVMRYTLPAFRSNPWSVHSHILQANALVLLLMEQYMPIYIHRSFRGCSAVYETQDQVISSGVSLQKLLHTKQIPAGLALYKDVGYWEEDTWISSQEYVAEHIAMLSQHHDLCVLESLIAEIQLPLGLGMLPAAKALQKLTGEGFCLLQDYRDYDENQNQNTQNDN